MKRKHSQEESPLEIVKMSRLEITDDVDRSMAVSEIPGALARHFSYELSDKKAKSNLLKAAARDILVIVERQLCTMMTFNVGSYLKIVIPIVLKWQSGVQDFKVQDLDIQITEIRPVYDLNKKHMETLIKLVVNSDKISVSCYNSTQRMKVEGLGYLDFIKKFLKPLLDEQIGNIKPEELDRYNKSVIDALSGKRKAISRPMRSVRYKAMAKLSCGKCDNSFLNSTQLNKHKKSMHTRGTNESRVFTGNTPIVDQSLLDDSIDVVEVEAKQITLEEVVITGPVADIPREASDALMETDSLFCTKCDFECKDEQTLTFHKSASHENLVSGNEVPQIYNCGSCEKKCESFADMEEHINEEHKPSLVDEVTSDVEVETLQSCDKCDFTSEDVEVLSNHFAVGIHNILDQNKTLTSDEKKQVNASVTISPEASANCKKCPKVFENEAALKKHMQEDHIIVNVYNCKKCEYKTTVREEFGGHLDTSHPPVQEIACEGCAFTSIDEKVIEAHKQASHMSAKVDLNVADQNVITCDQFAYKCKYNIQLKKHHQSSHETTSTIEPFPCEACGLALATFELLEDHIDSIHNQLKVNCKYCDYVAKDQESWHGHLVDNHEEYVILHSMAKQVDNLTDDSESLGQFKVDVLDTLKAILENQNQMKQELFLIRNSQSTTSTQPSVNRSEEVAGSPRPPTATRGQSASSSRPPPPPPPTRANSRSQGSTTKDDRCQSNRDKSHSTPQQPPPPPRHEKTEDVQKSKTLYVGDSISGNVNFDTLQEDIKGEIIAAKAYSSIYD